MKLFTTTLAVALLSQMGAAHAGDDIYLTYWNSTNSSLQISYDQKNSICMYQDQIPDVVVVPPGQNVGPYYAETNYAFFGECDGGVFNLNILKGVNKTLTQCRFYQKAENGKFMLEHCTGDQSMYISIYDAQKGGFAYTEDTLTIVFDDKPNTNSNLMVKNHLIDVKSYNTSKINPMMNRILPHHTVTMPNVSHSHMPPPHAGHEAGHYNTSRINPMMNQHKMEFHQGRPMVNNQRVMNQPQRPTMNQRKFEGYQEVPKIHPMKK